MGKEIPVLSALVLAAAVARANAASQDPAVPPAESGHVSYGEAAARFTFPGGGISGFGGVTYRDLLGTGIGAEIQDAELWRISRWGFNTVSATLQPLCGL
jgi:hypothetical protein